MSKPNINLKYREQDGMMLPDLQISNSSEADQPLGRYGRMALEYLRENHPERFTTLKMDGSLMEIMHRVQDEATEKIDDDFYEDLVDILIMSDMGVRTSDKVIQELKARVEKEKITDAKKAREILKEILKEIMSMPRKPLKWPMVMLVVGVNGVGKTTTIGKLSAQLKAEGKKVLLCAGDTFRAAAAEQLGIWAERSGVDIVRHEEGSDPAAVVYDGICAAKARNSDVIIIDTAGRLHNKANLMNELSKIRRIIDRELPEADVETLMVLDATTGQNGLLQAKQFLESSRLTGIVLTKLDGTAKGGIVFAITSELNIPVKYVGVGEGIDDLIPFDAKTFAEALFK